MLLNGWKEIACYLKTSVRTVQRWELSGLPIARPGDGLRGSVIVYSIQLDRWLQHRRSMSSLRVSTSFSAARILMKENVRRAQVLAIQIAMARDQMSTTLEALRIAASETRCRSAHTGEPLATSLPVDRNQSGG